MLAAGDRVRLLVDLRQLAWFNRSLAAVAVMLRQGPPTVRGAA